MSKSDERVTALGNGQFRVEHEDGRQTIAYAAADGTRTWVFLDDASFVLEPKATRRGGGGHDSAALAAPMPATVTRVHVAPGQAVKAGDVLVTLEAMKMELPIRAVADGTVSAVHCRTGEMVQPGVTLVDVT